MSGYVRARGRYTFNNSREVPSSVEVQRGEVLPADHWAVLSSQVAEFEPVELDWQTAEAVDELGEVRAKLAKVAQRYGSDSASWSAQTRERAAAYRVREAELAALVRADVERRDSARDKLRASAANPAATEIAPSIDTPDPIARRTDMNASPRDVALRNVDAAHKSGLLPDHGAERVTNLIERSGVRESDAAARWAAVAGSAEYLQAFTKLLTDPVRGHMMWTEPERRAFVAVEEFRAMSLADAAGGFMVPLVLDPTIILSSNGSTDPMRRISRVVQTTGDAWTGVTSAGVTAEWLAEAAQAADATPAMSNPVIPVHKASVFVPYSVEIGADAVNFVQEITRLLVDAADQLQATAYISGDGVGKPTGILTALGAGQKIATATADVLVAADVYKPQDALPPRFQNNARWLANLPTTNRIQAMETAAGSKVFPEVATRNADGTSVLLRKPLHEASNMQTPGVTVGAGNDNVLLYGDFQQFVIADRTGTQVELVPHLLGAAGRPTGQRGLWLWLRTGSDSVVDGAFRLLQA